jgi:hypothetical protein
VSFAADAIGFYLQLDNTLSPELEVAAKDYERFTKSLDKWNTRAYKAASKGFGALTNLVQSFEELPKKAVKSYNAALAQIKKTVKPITQPLILELSPKAQKGFAKSVARSIAEVLSKVKIRLTATAPIKKSKFFDTSVSLRSQYKDIAQPPDMLGAFQGIPRFQKGGIVPGPGGIDEILALLSPGEAVIPADVVKELQGLAQTKSVSKGLADAIANIRGIATAAEKLKQMAELGIDPKASTKYNKAMEALNKELGVAREHFGKMAPELQRDLLPAFKQTTDQVEGFRDQGEEAIGTFSKLLKDILGPTRFMAIHRALGSLQEGFSNVQSAASNVGAEVGVTTDQFEGFMKNLNDVNVTLNLSRDQLSVLKGDLLDIARSKDLDPTAIGEAVEGLVNAGVRSEAQLRSLAGVAALVGSTTTLGFDQAAEQVGRLNDEFGFSEDQVTAYFMTLKKQSAAGWIDFQQLSQQSMEMLNTGFLSAFDTQEAQKSALENMGAFSTAMSSQWQATGTEMAQTFAKAMTDVDVRSQVAKIGVSFESLQAAVQEGDFTGVMEGMAATFEGMTNKESLAALEQFRQAVGFEGTAQELLNISKNADKTLEMLGDLRGETVATADAQSASVEALNRAQSGWDRMQISIKNTILSMVPGPVIEFFDEVNPQILISVGYLTKMGLEALIAGGRMLKGLVGLGGKALGFVGSKLGMVSKATTTITQTAGTGAAAPGFFAGMAAGLQALAPALTTFGTAMIGPGGLGLLALVGVGFAIAGMARVAAPAIVAIGEAIGAMVKPMFEAFKTMGAGQIVATAGAILVLGPAFAGLGAGMLAMSVGLAASAPGLIVFSAAMRLLSPKAAVGGIGDIIGGLLEAFKIDKKKLDTAVASVTGAVKFLVGITKIAGALTGLAVGSVISDMVSGLLGAFGVRSPMERLADQGRSIAGTISGLLTTFNFSASDLKRLQGVSATVEAVSAFTRGYVSIAKGLREVAPGLFERATGTILSLFGADSPMEALAAQSVTITDTVKAIIKQFAGVAGELAGADAAVSAMGIAAKVVEGFNPLAKAVVESGEHIGDLADGWIFSGPLTKIVEGLPSFRSGVVAIVAELAILRRNIGRTTAESLKDTIAIATLAVQGITKPVAALKPLADVMKDIKESAASVVTQRGPTIAAIKAAVKMGEGLKQEFARPVVARAELQKTVQVELDPNTTDKPVHEAIMKTNELLAQLIGVAGSNGGPRVAIAGVRSRARGVDPDTAAIAGGEQF